MTVKHISIVFRPSASVEWFTPTEVQKNRIRELIENGTIISRESFNVNDLTKTVITTYGSPDARSAYELDPIIVDLIIQSTQYYKSHGCNFSAQLIND